MPDNLLDRNLPLLAGLERSKLFPGTGRFGHSCLA